MFVLIAWFEARERAQKAKVTPASIGVISEKIVTYLTRWISSNEREYSAGKVLTAWVNETNGSVEAISASDDWLELHADRYMATHLLQALLKHGRKLDDTLKKYVKKWLSSEHSQNHPVDTSYLFRALREAGVSSNVFSTEALAFIETNNEMPPFNKARREMCCYWLEMGGDPELVRSALRQILDLDPKSEHVRFVFETWASVNPKDLKFWANDMVRWLSGNTSHPKAAYVFNFWYRHIGNAADIRSYAIAWLKQNFSDNQYPIILSQQYLNDESANDGKFPFVDLALPWLKANEGHQHSSFLFIAWTKRLTDFTPIMPTLYLWLKENLDHSAFPSLLARYAAVDKAGLEKLGLSEDSARKFLAKVTFNQHDCRMFELILSSPFGSDMESELGKTAIERARDYLLSFAGEVRSAFLIAKVLRLIRTQDWIVNVAEEWLVKFPLRHRANPVLQALLAVSSCPATYESQISEWLTKNQEYKFAGALLLDWAEKGGDISRFRNEAAAWKKAARANGDFLDVEQVELAYRLETI